MMSVGRSTAGDNQFANIAIIFCGSNKDQRFSQNCHEKGDAVGCNGMVAGFVRGSTLQHYR